jgi:hypothetical protein
MLIEADTGANCSIGRYGLQEDIRCTCIAPLESPMHAHRAFDWVMVHLITV